MPAPVRVSLGDFRADDTLEIVGHLITAKAASGFNSQYLKQIDVWQEELTLLEMLAQELADLIPASRSWTILLEYPVPRRNKLPDVILLAGELTFVIEFKFGATIFDPGAMGQVEDYALDLRDFHLESRGRAIIPILVATCAEATGTRVERPDQTESVWPVVTASPEELAALIAETFITVHKPGSSAIDPVAWDNSTYRPTPSIIDAACRLFGGHSVREISHSYADNLSVTTDALVAAIDEAQKNSWRTICFVTGVPGAGKTLTGLNAIHNSEAEAHQKRPGVFLSGNGPLVKIVRKALVRDAVRNRGESSKEAERKVGTFIQNVHAFIAYHVKDQPTKCPHEHVAVFDEAQRAWDAEKVKKEKGPTIESEAHTMLRIMERCPNWCVVVALVGGGQEIHDGEAGLEEWGHALAARPTSWQVLVSPEALNGGVSLAGHRLFTGPSPTNCQVKAMPAMHLNVSVRSVRAQQIAQWVQNVLAGKPEEARAVCEQIRGFPLVLTRDLEVARQWLRDRPRLERRCGLVASSDSIRHRAYGLEVSSPFRRGYAYAEWFLADEHDVRSSYQLEVVATEFECQGLELDWVGVCWGDDLCIERGRGAWKGKSLLLASEVEDVSALPFEGKNQIVVATVKRVVHFRIFDHDGKIIVDTDETRLSTQAEPIANFKNHLEKLWPPHKLTAREIKRLMPEIASIVGYTRWNCQRFRGKRWQAVRQEGARRYVLNKYRVLLTRARAGMVIWVPPGDPADPTRAPAPLDATAAYLMEVGVTMLDTSF